MADLPAVPRLAVRVLLLDALDRVLLVRFWDGEGSWWCTPGGGIEPGETDRDAVRREVREELGTEAVELGPCIWTRRHIGLFRGRPFDQTEHIYLGRTAAFHAEPTTGPLPEHGPDDIRWWTLDELAASAEVFAPRRSPELVQRLIRDGPPDAPMDVGI